MDNANTANAKKKTDEIKQAFLSSAISDISAYIQLADTKVAGDARKAIEAQTGVPVITSKNAAQLSQVVVDMIEGNVAPSGEDVDS